MRDSTKPAALAALAARLDPLAGRIARQIRAEVPGYAALPYAEHERDVLDQISGVLAGLQARQPPPETAIEHARAVGRRRAAAGLALPDVIEAYHIGYREIWNELLRLARAQPAPDGGGPDGGGPGGGGPGGSEALVELVGLLWNWFHRLSAAVAETHVEQSRRAATTRAALHRRLVEALLAGAVDQVAAAARDLGLDPAGPFRVALAAGVPEASVDALADRLAALPVPAAGPATTPAGPAGPAVGAIADDRVALVAQGLPEPDLLAALRAVAPEATVGVGLERPGAAGAVLSWRDADDALHRALRLGTTQGTVRFADDWLLAVLGRDADRLVGPAGGPPGAPLAAGAEVARRHPALAETVRAFAAGQFSVTACARALHIHPNSAKYRLDRWQALTGWDPRTFTGLVASVAALDLGPP